MSDLTKDTSLTYLMAVQSGQYSGIIGLSPYQGLAFASREKFLTTYVQKAEAAKAYSDFINSNPKQGSKACRSVALEWAMSEPVTNFVSRIAIAKYYYDSMSRMTDEELYHKPTEQIIETQSCCWGFLSSSRRLARPEETLSQSEHVVGMKPQPKMY